MIHLLDVNVLLALGYSAHVHNERAETWLQHLQTHNATVNLAMCSITELGFVRVASGKAGFAANVRMAQRDLAHLKEKQPFSFLAAGPDWCTRSGPVR